MDSSFEKDRNIEHQESVKMDEIDYGFNVSFLFGTENIFNFQIN